MHMKLMQFTGEILKLFNMNKLNNVQNILNNDLVIFGSATRVQRVILIVYLEYIIYILLGISNIHLRRIYIICTAYNMN